MSLNELIKTVGQLSKEEFQVFYNKIQALKSKKLGAIYSEQENKILKKVNTPFSKKKLLRFNYLIAKRDLQTLTEEEYQELLKVNASFEKFELRRLKQLTKLADLKQLSLPQVIDYYHISPIPNG